MKDKPSQATLFLEAARKYTSKGWAIFPLQSGKITLWVGNNGSGDATTVNCKIDEWFAPENNTCLCNLAVSTGMKSTITDQSLVVINWNIWESKNIPEKLKAFLISSNTLSAKTPQDGRHLYFHSEKNIQSRSIFPGLTVHGENDFVPAPPSVLEGDKNPYQWENDNPIANMPEWLIELMRGISR